MAPSQLPAVRMRNLLFGVILGLLAVVHSTPVTTVTQIPTKAEEEVIREALTDGFLVERSPFPSLTTEPPKQNVTVPAASQQPSSDSTHSDVIEGSGFATSVFPEYTTTTQSVPAAHSSTSTASPTSTEDSTSDSSTIRIPQSAFTSSSVPNEAKPSVTPDQTQTTHPAVSTDGKMLGQHSTTTSTHTETTPASSSSTAAFTRPKVPVTFSRSEGSGLGPDEGSGMFSTVSTTTEEATTKRASDGPSSTTKAPVTFGRSEGSGLGSDDGSGMFTTVSTTTTTTEALIEVATARETRGEVPVNPPVPQNRVGHNTPGWMIIVGFIVGLAALVMLCVAIATRDKWNGPRKASQPETDTNSTNQQREVEMETFLHKDEPRENGKAAEYTVIPLDELPEKHSSH